jgi:hypothetical protein
LLTYIAVPPGCLPVCVGSFRQDRDALRAPRHPSRERGGMTSPRGSGPKKEAGKGARDGDKSTKEGDKKVRRAGWGRRENRGGDGRVPWQRG